MRIPFWELWLLVLLMVTVFGLSMQGPSKSFRSAQARVEMQDPYDIQPERNHSERGHVETGL